MLIKTEGLNSSKARGLRMTNRDKKFREWIEGEVLLYFPDFSEDISYLTDYELMELRYSAILDTYLSRINRKTYVNKGKKNRLIRTLDRWYDVYVDILDEMREEEENCQ